MSENEESDNYEPYENKSNQPGKRGRAHRKSDLSQQDQPNARESGRVLKSRRDSYEVVSWRDEETKNNREEEKRRSRRRETKKRSQVPTDNMADVKIKVRGFKGGKYDSSTYKSKPARYQAVEEITVEELMEFTTTADLTGIIYNYEPPAKDSKEAIRLTKEEEEKINRNFADADPYAQLQ